MVEPQPVAEGRRRPTAGLWRLLPFAALALLVVGNWRHATEGVVSGLSGQDYVILALLVAAFLAAYGRPAGDAPQLGRAAFGSLGAMIAALLAIAIALLVSIPGLEWLAPRTPADWRVAGMDLIVTWLLVDFFRAWLRPGRSEPTGSESA